MSFCFLTPSLHSLLWLCTCTQCFDGVKDYVTVSQLNQLFGMHKVDHSTTATVQSFQAIVTDPVLSNHMSQCDPAQSLSAEVCVPRLSSIINICIKLYGEKWYCLFKADVLVCMEMILDLDKAACILSFFFHPTLPLLLSSLLLFFLCLRCLQYLGWEEQASGAQAGFRALVPRHHGSWGY